MREFKVEGLSQSIGAKQLFNQVDLSIMDHDKIGLIGINGTGKTTFLNTITGRTPSDSGTITKPKDYTISYLTQKHEMDLEQTILDTVYAGENPLMTTVKEYERVLSQLESNPTDPKIQEQFTRIEQQMTTMDAWNASTSAKSILSRLGITNLDQKVGNLSGGQQKRVQLAQVLIQKPDLLILDEPTNHLDYHMISWLEEYLKAYKGAVLLVTHDRYFLDRVVTQIVELSFGTLQFYQGNYQDYVRQKAEREEIENQQRHKDKQLYKKELAWMREGVRARGTKQEARKSRFHDLKERVNNQPSNESIKMNLEGARLGKKVIEFEDACFQRDQAVILDNFNLLIQKNDRIGVTGKNGSGKSTFLNLLTGRLQLDQGKLEIGETVKIAYYTQNNEDLDPNKRVIEYLREVAEEVQAADGTMVSVTQLLEQFMFPKESHGSYIRSLSGGEKRRLFLLKLLMQQPNVLVLDEPTNDLDIQTLTILEDYIDHFSGAVISVSHDRYFLDKISNKLLVFQGEGRIEEHFTSLTEYLENKREESSSKKQSRPEKQKTVNRSEKQSKQKTKLNYHEQKEWASIEDEIEALENQLEAVQQEMVEAGSDFAKISELNAQQSELEEKLEVKMERWEYLSEFVD